MGPAPADTDPVRVVRTERRMPGGAAGDAAPERADALRRHGAGRAAAMAALAAAPFVVARLAYAPDGAAGPTLVCPFRELTGLPCPLCGATRAVALAAHGDTRFLEYGAVWVLVLAALALAGVVGLVTRRRLPTPPALPLAVVVTAAAWAWALAHADTIAP